MANIAHEYVHSRKSGAMGILEDTSAEGDSSWLRLVATLPRFNDFIQVSVARVDNTVGFHVATYVKDTEAQPREWVPRHLSLVNNIVGDIPWDTPLGPTNPRVENVASAAELDALAGVIKSARARPVIVVSKTAEGPPLVNPQLLATTLVGMTDVYALNPKQEGAFKKIVGHQYELTGGAVQIFWPGMHGQADKITVAQLRACILAGDENSTPEDLVRAPVVALAKDSMIPSIFGSSLERIARNRTDQSRIKIKLESENKDLRAKVAAMEQAQSSAPRAIGRQDLVLKQGKGKWQCVVKQSFRTNSEKMDAGPRMKIWSFATDFAHGKIPHRNMDRHQFKQWGKGDGRQYRWKHGKYRAYFVIEGQTMHLLDGGIKADFPDAKVDRIFGI